MTLADDYLDLDSLFTPEELALRDRVRAFVDKRIHPNIASWYATVRMRKRAWSATSRRFTKNFPGLEPSSAGCW